MRDSTTRTQLIAMLTEAQAHVMFDDAISDFPTAKSGERPGNIAHSAWQLLEHLRIAQRDILEFSRNPDHVSPAWPDGYWPESAAPPDEEAWENSVAQFIRDLAAFVDLIADESNDLLEPFPWGDGQTLFREALVLGSHNSYHLGQLVQLKKVLTK